MKHYWRYGHLSSINIKVGDQVKRGDLIGHMGGTGGWLSHLHLDCFKVKPTQWTNYVIGKSIEFVEENYDNPGPYVTPTIPTLFDHPGYGWLEKANYSGKPAYHSGIDINGPGAGNADLGQPIYSVCDGEVKFIYDGTEANGGWGKLIIIKEQFGKKEDEIPEPEKNQSEESSDLPSNSSSEPVNTPEDTSTPIQQNDELKNDLNASQDNQFNLINMMSKLKDKLQGYKTYILATAGIAVTVAYMLGMLDENAFNSILTLLGFGSAATLGAKINRALK